VTIELGALVLAGIVWAITWWLGYKKEDVAWRRGAQVLLLILAVVGALVGLEAYQRKVTMDLVPMQLEREWSALQDTAIAGIEVEVLSPNGMLAPGILELAKGVKFSVQGLALFPSSKESEAGEIDFASAFSLEHVKEASRVGYSLAQVQTSKKGDAKTIEHFDAINCIASHTNALLISKRPTFAKDVQGSCSVAIALPVSNELYLRNIAAATTVNMSVKLPKDQSCLGICNPPFLFSVKAIMRGGSTLVPTMIELSPQVLRQFPSAISSDDTTREYSLTGAHLMEVVKSQFLQSYGHRERESFAFTKGLFTDVYMRLTKATVTLTFIDVVWTTDNNPTEKSLLEAIPPSARETAEAFRTPEWCGFGEASSSRNGSSEKALCWNRFAIFGPSAGS